MTTVVLTDIGGGFTLNFVLSSDEGDQPLDSLSLLALGMERHHRPQQEVAPESLEHPLGVIPLWLPGDKARICRERERLCATGPPHTTASTLNNNIYGG